MLKEFAGKVLSIKFYPFDIIIMRIKRPEGFLFDAGQYISVDIPSKGVIVRRPYSIASSPSKDYIELCIRKIPGGKGLEYLSNLKTEDSIDFFGPFGKFVCGAKLDKDIIFIAPGISITPIKSMIEDLLERGSKGKLILIRGSRNENDLPYEKEILEIENKYDNFKVYHTFSQPINKYFESKGHIQKFIPQFIPKNFHEDVYICGFFEMIREISKILVDNGISSEKIFSEGHHRYPLED